MTINIAIMGAGRIAETAVIPAIEKIGGARVTAILSRDQARAESFAERNSIARAYSDLGTLCGDSDIDAVIVASPDALHEPQVIAAAKAGKHILCEKPMTTTYAGCIRMAEAVRDSGVTFMMGYTNRFNAGTSAMKRLMDEEKIGNVRHARAFLTTFASDPTAWRAHTDEARFWAMSASGTHVIDLYRWFFGEPASVGGGLASPVYGSANDEIATYILNYPGKLLAELTVAAIIPNGNRLELHGDGGTLIGENVFGRAPGAWVSCNGENVELKEDDPFQHEIEEFLGAINEGREPSITLEDGLRNVRIMETVREGATLVTL
jgi:predicted dehydrogenase